MVWLVIPAILFHIDNSYVVCLIQWAHGLVTGLFWFTKSVTRTSLLYSNKRLCSYYVFLIQDNVETRSGTICFRFPMTRNGFNVFHLPIDSDMECLIKGLYVLVLYEFVSTLL